MSAVELEEPQTLYTPPTDLSLALVQKNLTFQVIKARATIVAFIGQGVEFKGTIIYKGSVRIDGRLEGALHTEGTLLVGKDAVITAKISAGSVISKGKITGDIVAKEKILLLSSANMDGSLNSPQLSIEEGVIFNGTIEMKR